MQKGVVFIGDDVYAKVDPDESNGGSSALQVVFADRHDHSVVEHCAAAPAGSCSTEPVTAADRGRVTVLLTPVGGGTLTVFVNGEPRDSEHVDGVTEWVYEVVEQQQQQQQQQGFSPGPPKRAK